MLAHRASVETQLKLSITPSFLAIAHPHSGDRLIALSISSCGLLLDDEAVRLAASLHLGMSSCSPHYSGAYPRGGQGGKSHSHPHAPLKQEAQLMLTNPRDAFRGQSRSTNIVPFHKLGIVSSFCRYSTSKMSWPWNPGQTSLKVIESGTIP